MSSRGWWLSRYVSFPAREVPATSRVCFWAESKKVNLGKPKQVLGPFALVREQQQCSVQGLSRSRAVPSAGGRT